MSQDLHSIAVGDLRLGMYVHLDMHWIRHPFARNHFLIQSQQQLDTIRSLGLQTVRIRPSLCVDEQAEVFNEDPPKTDAPSIAPNQNMIRTPSLIASPAVSAFDLPLDVPDIVNRQFNEATRQFKNAVSLIRTQPGAALNTLTGLTNSILSVANTADQTYLRLMQDVASDRITGHAMNVTVLSVMLGKCACLGEEELAAICLGALMHDIGKLEIPEKLRYRTPTLTWTEAKYYEEHVSRGMALVKRMELSTLAQDIVAQHHEQFDGNGFPLKLGGDAIVRGARVVAIANRYDNLCNPAQRVLAMTPHETLRNMYSKEGPQFDPKLMALFVKMLGIYPPGTYVQLTDERYALVVSVREGQVLKPNVLLYDPSIAREDAQVTILENAGGLSIRRSVRPDQLPMSVNHYFSSQHRLSYFFERPSSALGSNANVL